MASKTPFSLKEGDEGLKVSNTDYMDNNGNNAGFHCIGLFSCQRNLKLHKTPYTAKCVLLCGSVCVYYKLKPMTESHTVHLFCLISTMCLERFRANFTM